MCCSSVKLWKGTVVAGYGTGQIRIYEAVTGILHAEVNAHARWIYSLDIAPFSGLVSAHSSNSQASIAKWKCFHFELAVFELASFCCWRLSRQGLAPLNDSREQHCGGKWSKVTTQKYVCVPYESVYLHLSGCAFAQRVCDGHADLWRQVLRWWWLCLCSDGLWFEWDYPLHTDVDYQISEVEIMNVHWIILLRNCSLTQWGNSLVLRLIIHITK